MQKSSKEAIQKSWNQVEALHQTSVDNDEQIDQLEDEVLRRRQRLDRFLSRIEELEPRLNAVKEVRSTPSIASHNSFGNAFTSASLAGFHNITRRAFMHPSPPDSATLSLQEEKDKLAELRSLHLELISRNATVDSMERAFTHNVKMMQNFQLKMDHFQELREHNRIVDEKSRAQPKNHLVVRK